MRQQFFGDIRGNVGNRHCLDWLCHGMSNYHGNADLRTRRSIGIDEGVIDIPDAIDVELHKHKVLNFHDAAVTDARHTLRHGESSIESAFFATGELKWEFLAVEGGSHALDFFRAYKDSFSLTLERSPTLQTRLNKGNIVVGVVVDVNGELNKATRLEGTLLNSGLEKKTNEIKTFYFLRHISMLDYVDNSFFPLKKFFELNTVYLLKICKNPLTDA